MMALGILGWALTVPGALAGLAALPFDDRGRRLAVSARLTAAAAAVTAAAAAVTTRQYSDRRR